MLKKPLSLVLGLLAIGVLLHFVFAPFYEDLVDTGRMWDVVNWFMAVGVILTLAVPALAGRALETTAKTPTDTSASQWPSMPPRC